MKNQIQQSDKQTSPIDCPDSDTFEKYKLNISGTYKLRVKPVTGLPLNRQSGELRLDVDGWYPQMTVSVTLTQPLKKPSHFIASVSTSDHITYQGKVWYSSSPALMNQKIKLKVSAFQLGSKPSVTLSGPGVSKSSVFDYVTSTFHPLKLEYDYASDAASYRSFDTGTHPNRPASLPVETLTISKVYRRAGFSVTDSAESGSVPISGAGTDAQWSSDEMHDAMETYFSQYSVNAKWAAWVFFASLSDDGPDLGGIMFDSNEAPTRQGCAIFVNSFISDEPAGDPDASAYVQRMRFWCACHELGHCMNLAHSWQKELGEPYGSPWTTITNNSESRSLMNYPFLVSGGSTAYFNDHEYRFDDMELIFLRHAPYRFVQPGNAEWFHDHGFEQTIIPGAPLELSLRTNKPDSIYEFLECIVLELKLKNVTKFPRVIDEKLISRGFTTIVIQKKGGAPREYRPYSKSLYHTKPVILDAGKSIYESVFVSAGVNGFDLAEPGDYIIRCALQVEGMIIVSAPLNIRISPPTSYAEERIAQDFFSHSVGRVLAFDGSRIYTKGMNVLREVVEALPERRVTRHAKVALGLSLASDKKILNLSADRKKRIDIVKSSPEESKKLLSSALLGDSTEISSTLSHIDYNDYMHSFIDLLENIGDKKSLESATTQLQGCLDRIGAPAKIKAMAKR